MARNDKIDDVVKSEAIYIDSETESVLLNEEEFWYEDEYDNREYYNYVGMDDPADFAKISLRSAANLSFTIDATDAAKFTIWSLVPGKNGAYSQKALQSTALKFDLYSEIFTATTAPLLLAKGTYYISVESTNANAGGEAYYNVDVNHNGSAFFEDVEDDNNWTDMKTKGPASEQYDTFGEYGLNEESYVEGWVGFGDSIDYYRFSLGGAANLSFDVGASDAAKFTIYTLTGSKGNYALKALQSTALAKRTRTLYYDEDEDEYYYDDEEEFYEYGTTTKSLLLEKGNYYFSVESTNAQKGGSAGYNVSVSWNSAFFEDVEDENNWTDMKTRGAASEQYDTMEDIGYESGVEGWVGFGDPIDYYRFSLDGAANLSFDVGASDVAKFTIYTLTGSKGNYALKALQSTALAKRTRTLYYDEELGGYYYDEDEDFYEYGTTTKSLLLEKGNYYFSVESTNAKKGGNAGYNVSVSWNSAFFEDVEDENNWNDMKTRGPASEQYDTFGEYGLNEDSGVEGWVGFGDPIDYYRFSLGGAANLSFDVGASDVAKFTIYTLTGSKGNYALKALQSTALAKRTRPLYYDEDEDEYYYDDEEEFYEYGTTTKLLLLEKGNYYFSVESTNAKKGGNAGYNVSVSWNSVFFEDVEDNNNWTDLKSNGSRSEQYDTFGGDGLNEESSIEGWVGFGDPIDYYKFSLGGAANLSFDVGASDVAKFTIYTLTGSKGNYALKALQSTALAKRTRPLYYDEDEDEYYYDEEEEFYEYGTTTKLLLLEKGNYYLSVESTNAQKGGSADYNVSVTWNSVFFDDVEDGNNWTDMKTNGSRSEQYDILEDGLSIHTYMEGWVGFGDSIDYYRFSLDGAAKLSFGVYATDAAKFTIYTLTGSKGNYALKALQSTALAKRARPLYYDEDEDEYYYDEDEEFYEYATTTKSLLLEKGNYYFSVESTNAKKGGSADYDLFVNENGSAFFEEVEDENNWTDLKTNGSRSDQYDELEDGLNEDTYIEGWVGLGDPVDYYRFSLETAAKLSFVVSASDAAKFSIYTLTGSKGNYALKALQSTALAKRTLTIYSDEEGYDYFHEYATTTKPLLLESGSYYLSVESTNAQKGGSADYDVSLSWNSAFFEDVEDENNWTDLTSAGRNGEVDNLEEISYETEYSGWVGFGDAIDYAVFHVSGNASSFSPNAAVLCFDIEATDSVKVTIYSITEKIKNNEKTYSLKSLQSTSTKQIISQTSYDDEEGDGYDFVARTKGLAIKQAGYYAISVQSTNAAKGGNASYNVTINEDYTDFFDYDYDLASLDFQDGGQDLSALTGPEIADASVGIDDWKNISASDGGLMQDELFAGLDSAQGESLSSVAAFLDSAPENFFGESGKGMLAGI